MNIAMSVSLATVQRYIKTSMTRPSRGGGGGGGGEGIC